MRNQTTPRLAQVGPPLREKIVERMEIAEEQLARIRQPGAAHSDGRAGEIYLLLAFRADSKTGEIRWWSLERIANRVGCSPRTVSDDVELLIRLGLLTKRKVRQRGQWPGNVFTLRQPISSVEESPTGTNDQRQEPADGKNLPMAEGLRNDLNTNVWDGKDLNTNAGGDQRQEPASGPTAGFCQRQEPANGKILPMDQRQDPALTNGRILPLIQEGIQEGIQDFSQDFSPFARARVREGQDGQGDQHDPHGPALAAQGEALFGANGNGASQDPPGIFRQRQDPADGQELPPVEPSENDLSNGPTLADCLPYEGYDDEPESAEEVVKALKGAAREYTDDDFIDLVVHVWAYERAHKRRKPILDWLDVALPKLRPLMLARLNAAEGKAR